MKLLLFCVQIKVVRYESGSLKHWSYSSDVLLLLVLWQVTIGHIIYRQTINLPLFLPILNLTMNLSRSDTDIPQWGQSVFTHWLKHFYKAELNWTTTQDQAREPASLLFNEWLSVIHIDEEETIAGKDEAGFFYTYLITLNSTSPVLSNHQSIVWKKGKKKY